MIDIIQQPSAINYSLSLLDIVVTNSDPVLEFKLVHEGVIILEEEYHSPPDGEKLVIPLKKTVTKLLQSTAPDYNELVTEEPNAVKSFTVELQNSIDQKEITFTVIKGFNRSGIQDLEGFLRDNWLTLMPRYSKVYFHQPLYISAIPQSSVRVMLKAKLKDNTEVEVEYATLKPYILQHINLNPGKIIGQLGQEFIYVDVYSLQGSTIRNGYLRLFYGGIAPHFSDFYTYRNRLSGWDSLVMSGIKERLNKAIPKTSLIKDHTHEFDTDREYSIKKDSGFISSENQRRQMVDFIYSSERYHFHQGKLESIYLTDEGEIRTDDGELSSFEFTYSYSDHDLNYPELGLTTNFLNI